MAKPPVPTVAEAQAAMNAAVADRDIMHARQRAENDVFKAAQAEKLKPFSKAVTAAGRLVGRAGLADAKAKASKAAKDAATEPESGQ